MDSSKKRKGGAEKARVKKQKLLGIDAEQYNKITDMFRKAGGAAAEVEGTTSMTGAVASILKLLLVSGS